MGIEPDLQQVGYLFLIATDGDAAAFERSLELWKRLGVPARRVDPTEAKTLFPSARTDDVRFATFCAKDGYADPSSMLAGYVARAREGGVQFVEHTAVTKVMCEKSRVVGVRAGDDEVAAAAVVDGAGPWGAEVAKLADIDLPIQPLRRHIFVTEIVPGLDREFPLTIDFSTGP